MQIIVVGKSKLLDKTKSEERVYKYSDIPTDEQKWVFNLKYMPIPYDLMHLKLKGLDKIKSGWWNGIRWKGLRLKRCETVIAWKRNQEHD
jgi:hypothetical protein